MHAAPNEGWAVTYKEIPPNLHALSVHDASVSVSYQILMSSYTAAAAGVPAAAVAALCLANKGLLETVSLPLPYLSCWWLGDRNRAPHFS